MHYVLFCLLVKLRRWNMMGLLAVLNQYYILVRIIMSPLLLPRKIFPHTIITCHKHNLHKLLLHKNNGVLNLAGLFLLQARLFIQL